MTSEYLEKLNLSCNWETADERDIKNTITFGSSADNGDESELSDIVSLETCVRLFSPDSASSSPELNFNFAPNIIITALKIVSEARIIELFGKGGEYVSTTHSDFLDDFEGMAVYSAFVKLAIPSSECTIKFKKLKNQESIWIYGMGIYTQASKGLHHDGAQVDFKSVNERLQRSGCDLSGNAEQCLRLLNTFQTISNPLSLKASDGSNPNTSGNAEAHRKMCDLFLSVSPMLSKFRSSSHGSSSSFSAPSSSHDLHGAGEPNPGKFTSPSHSLSSDAIKTLISDQFQLLENRLVARVDERLKKIEEKLDMMLLTVQMQDAKLTQ
ncbi:uncharacterized protein LOC124155641 [Ischnura elegans]|uniref:uncharacterized protein LOC124155641 n=1 Tax=Ischnura elegans TaxID=197161 RepID=UPI001ED86944|nr:uncharacterized protein LOC124155641 [Ischnura elegans]